MTEISIQEELTKQKINNKVIQLFNAKKTKEIKRLNAQIKEIEQATGNITLDELLEKIRRFDALSTQDSVTIPKSEYEAIRYMLESYKQADHQLSKMSESMTDKVILTSDEYSHLATSISNNTDILNLQQQCKLLTAQNVELRRLLSDVDGQASLQLQTNLQNALQKNQELEAALDSARIQIQELQTKQLPDNFVPVHQEILQQIQTPKRQNGVVDLMKVKVAEQQKQIKFLEQKLQETPLIVMSPHSSAKSPVLKEQKIAQQQQLPHHLKSESSEAVQVETAPVPIQKTSPVKLTDKMQQKLETKLHIDTIEPVSFESAQVSPNSQPAHIINDLKIEIIKLKQQLSHAQLTHSQNQAQNPPQQSSQNKTSQLQTQNDSIESQEQLKQLIEQNSKLMTKLNQKSFEPELLQALQMNEELKKEIQEIKIDRSLLQVLQIELEKEKRKNNKLVEYISQKTK
ncbi:Hypothetical_protein [Hexamita inflata]|uniref:Hypothetical_protein n=1 Tax=Hexamita inflata TaxID=28002 RepID=A0AA86NYW6_9EUKA|nr:Hypothetical protein HINF_LOCUS15202 [Hexamita inflata]